MSATTIKEPLSPEQRPGERDGPTGGKLRSVVGAALRSQFPILRQTIRGKPLVYLDNAATTQKPQSVLDAMARYYSEENANVHRGVHLLSERATRAYEGARARVQRLLNAASPAEIVFTRGTTESINLIASSFGRRRLEPGDEVLVTWMEHHSNIVPWQLICEERGATLRAVPINDRGELMLDAYETMLTPRTRIVAVVHVSNALGTINPVREMIRMAHEREIPVLVDGAQATPHLRVDVQDLDADFYALSGHKMYGPTGIGALYGKERLLDAIPPYQGGGEMIRSVSFEKTTYSPLPGKFEAGTPNIAGAVGLGAAVEFLEEVGIEAIAAHEHDLLEYATQTIAPIPGIRLIGTAREKAGVLSFTLGDVHPHDLGTILDAEGIAIRTGNHCAQPAVERFGVPATARASFAAYNAREDVDALVRSLHKVSEVFG
jgi:cysteine desulfurase/selenocysteine lyase